MGMYEHVWGGGRDILVSDCFLAREKQWGSLTACSFLGPLRMWFQEHSGCLTEVLRSKLWSWRLSSKHSFLVLLFTCFVSFVWNWSRVPLGTFDWPATNSVDQDRLALNSNLSSALVTGVLGLKAHTTRPSWTVNTLNHRAISQAPNQMFWRFWKTVQCHCMWWCSKLPY